MGGGGGYGRTCATRDDEPRPVWTSLPITHCMCVFITAVPVIKLFAWGEGDSGGHVLRETTSRGLCGLGCPSRTSERGGNYIQFCVFPFGANKTGDK
jgi:hypothetical protein